MYIISATCSDLTVGHHQALQTVYNIKGIHKNLPDQNQDLSFTKFLSCFITGVIYIQIAVKTVKNR